MCAGVACTGCAAACVPRAGRYCKAPPGGQAARGGGASNAYAERAGQPAGEGASFERCRSSAWWQSRWHKR
eukprot:1160014-Pelagomonas_calceolata.AAC.10